MRNKITLLIILILIILNLVGIFFIIRKTSILESVKQTIAKEQPLMNEKAQPKLSTVKILFVGDIMLDRHIRQASEKNGYDFIFQKTDELLADNDLVVGNLEGPITDNKSVSLQSRVGERNNFIFTFDPAITEVLKKRNISLVNIGNNHIENFGSAGIKSTRDYLAQSSINFFGDPEIAERRFAILNFNGKKIAFVNYNQFVLNAEQKALEDLEKVKDLKADFVILYTHWGEEYKTEPNEKIRILAHKFIDEGTDLIIGTHPHVIQSTEKYKNKMIYYSLGNFVFDQYFDTNTKKGLVVEANFDFTKNEISSKELFISMESNGQTVFNK